MIRNEVYDLIIQKKSDLVCIVLVNYYKIKLKVFEF